MPPRRPTKMDPFEQEIEAALQPGYFIKYGAGWPFVEGLDRVEDKIAKLVPSAPARAIALYETFLAGGYEKAEELDSSSGNFGMFVDGLFRGWVKARQAAGSDPDESFCYQLEREHHRKTGFMSGFEEVVAGGGPSAKPMFLERAKARWSPGG
jgi:hypothetical protein